MRQRDNPVGAGSFRSIYVAPDRYRDTTQGPAWLLWSTVFTRRLRADTAYLLTDLGKDVSFCCNMRTVSFVEHIEFEFPGNLFSKAITVGDVDNDQSNELVLGNIDGDLYIFKGADSRPWAKAAELGMITCLEIGDVCNHGMNVLVVLTVEGWCHVFVLQNDHRPQDEGHLADPLLIKATHTEHLAANSKVLLIADIDGDGLCELVIGYSDRRVRAYKWRNSGDQLPLTPGCLTGKFVLMENWQLAGQIGSMTITKADLMVSQPGGTFVTLLRSNSRVQQETQGGDKEEVLMSGPSLIYHPLGSARSRNAGVTTEVIGNISRKKKSEEPDTEPPNYSAICTLDGTLTLVDVDKILWSIYVGHQLFSLTKLDVTGDGREEVVACSWDGHTYLINLTKEVVRFLFRENVAAFCAGHYAVEQNKNVPCLIYVTFNNRVVVYHRIHMPQIGTTNLIHTMDALPDTHGLLNYFNCDASKEGQVRQLYHWCLYGTHSKPT